MRIMSVRHKQPIEKPPNPHWMPVVILLGMPMTITVVVIMPMTITVSCAAGLMGLVVGRGLIMASRLLCRRVMIMIRIVPVMV